MAKINILSAEICNRIAAGEVIDRPYSVVKELVENSLDAGATEIEIHIERGGKDLIRVTDNGCGIEEDDMRAAFFAHATSKIAEIDDIDRITTLGFRGEALATVASVAQVELISAVEGCEAHRVVGDGNYIGNVEPAVFDKGTQITVKNLFFNTPVRAKFMRTDKKEEADITSFITRFILGYPTVTFRYFVNGKLALQSYGSGIDDAVAAVYGADVLPKCFKISADRNDVKISGFIGNQNFFKPNKTYQNVFLNGRCVVNQIISSAILNAYSPYLMKKQFPFYVLFIEVPMDTVDVNVHPNKADVRFVDNQLIYGSVYKIISSVLDGTAKAADFVVDSKILPEIKSSYEDRPQKSVYAAEFKQTKTYDKNFDDIQMPSFVKKPEKGAAPAKTEVPFPEVAENGNEIKRINITDEDFYKFYVDSESDQKHVMTACNGVTGGKTREQYEAEKLLKEIKQQNIDYVSCKYKGNLFNTYLIYEIKDEVYLIDQHAAHERLLYDAFREKVGQRNTISRQGMLVPYIFDVNSNENEFLESNLQLIREMGFDIEPFGINSYRVNEVPSDLKDINLQNFFGDLLNGVNSLKTIKVEEMLKDKIATAACKHAVKGGMELTEAERDALFAKLHGNMGLKCPHGRPVCVKLTKTQIEKMFKRIV